MGAAIAGALQKAHRLLFKGEESGYPLFEVLEKTLDSVQRTLISYHLGSYPPDVLINISKDVCGTFDFHKAASTIEAGRMAAKEALAVLQDPFGIFPKGTEKVRIRLSTDPLR